MSVRPNLAGSAAGLSGAMTSIGGAILASFSAAVLYGLVAERLVALLLVATLAGLAAGIAAWRGLHGGVAAVSPFTLHNQFRRQSRRLCYNMRWI